MSVIAFDALSEAKSRWSVAVTEVEDVARRFCIAVDVEQAEPVDYLTHFEQIRDLSPRP